MRFLRNPIDKNGKTEATNKGLNESVLFTEEHPYWVPSALSSCWLIKLQFFYSVLWILWSIETSNWFMLRLWVQIHGDDSLCNSMFRYTVPIRYLIRCILMEMAWGKDIETYSWQSKDFVKKRNPQYSVFFDNFNLHYIFEEYAEVTKWYQV